MIWSTYTFLNKGTEGTYSKETRIDMGVKGRRERTETDGLGEELANLKWIDGVHRLNHPPHFPFCFPNSSLSYHLHHFDSLVSSFFSSFFNRRTTWPLLLRFFSSSSFFSFLFLEMVSFTFIFKDGCYSANSFDTSTTWQTY